MFPQVPCDLHKKTGSLPEILNIYLLTVNIFSEYNHINVRETRTGY